MNEIIHFLNESAEVIPRFGIVQTAGAVAVPYDSSELVYSGVKPTTGTGDARHGISIERCGLGTDGESGARGTICFPDHRPFWALYETSDGTPAVNDIWGPGSGGWKLRNAGTGFRIVGQPTGGRVLVKRDINLGGSGGGFFIGVTTTFHAVGTTELVSVYDGTPGSETATGESRSVHNKFADVPEGYWVGCCNNGDGWYLVAASCEAPEESSSSSGV